MFLNVRFFSALLKTLYVTSRRSGYYRHPGFVIITEPSQTFPVAGPIIWKTPSNSMTFVPVLRLCGPSVSI